MLTNKEYLLFHEKKHLSFLKDNVGECALFFKRDTSFPISPCPIYLVGNGVRHPIIGGDGSGAVNVRYKETFEEAFIEAGFEITSKDYLDKYDSFKVENEKGFVAQMKVEARENNMMPVMYAIGRIPLAGEFEYPLSSNGAVAIYILSRNAGEGADRQLKKGDVLLTDSEIKTINYLNEHYSKFMLVLNVPGVVELEPVLNVKNILYLSQLGSLTPEVLVDIVLGKINPTGKLTTTWGRISDYPYINTPIRKDENRFTEGIYVGYRYFSSYNISPLFPFGFGLSYSEFKYELINVSNSKDTISMKVNVTNVSNVPGKEVIQAYLSYKGNSRAKLNLVSYKKTKILDKGESEVLALEFKLSDFPTYNEELARYEIEGGDYLVSVSNSSENLLSACHIIIKETVSIKEVKNVFAKPNFDDPKVDVDIDFKNLKVKTINLDKSDFFSQKTAYLPEYKVKIPEFVQSLSVDDLILLSLGDYKVGFDGMVGQSCSLVLGGAGETTLRVKGLNKALNMVDGPAGLRLASDYILNSKGAFSICEDSIWKSISPYLPKIVTSIMDPNNNKKKKGTHVIQSATALPIATALAQSFNPDFIRECGRLVKEEMELYGVDIWLAPALNIHRSILCGRNFEYYSEDPLVSGISAAMITEGVQKDSNKIVTIKHFACNSQETNRMNNNSIVSEKACREIYLSGFEKAIKLANPKSIMVAYNLLNGEHCSSHRGLIIDILRSEWKYDGLVMSDWVSSGQSYERKPTYPSNSASQNIKNGTNICMPGSKKDIKDIKKAIKNGYLTIEELRNNASVVYNFINENKDI